MDSLLKLTRAAKRRICITVATGVNPRVDERILPVPGIESDPCMDDVYTLAILSALGYLPEVRYIHTSRRNTFTNFDDALEKYMRMVPIAKGSDAKNTSDSELVDIRCRLTQWLEDNLEKSSDVQGRPCLRYKSPRTTTWAFISWENE